MTLQAVIFDMDGLLTDSETVARVILKDAGRRMGAEISDRLLDDLTGVNRDECVTLLRAALPGLDAEALLAVHSREMDAAARRGDVPLKPGVRELLDALDARRIPRAVASSTERALVETHLARHGLLDRFDCLVCGDMIRRSKPAPDIYLAAAEALGITPADCLVLEDSPNGLKSGRAAGMRTCMVPDRLPYTDALKPYVDDVCASLLDVIPLIAPWLS